MTDPADAAKAIEGLKAWIAREGGVAWPKHRATLARKRALVDAQAVLMRRKLPNFTVAAFGNLQGYGSNFDDYDEPTLDRLSAAIGRMIRRDGDEQRKESGVTFGRDAAFAQMREQIETLTEHNRQLRDAIAPESR